ncbi:hypothetical protein THER5_1923 [Bifidobacterium thermacidophilum subsp. thermacidophilum]|uniref:Uncharacterized protein n=1 Tax=Bifidobacterium thermacidophilum subsp. thermacidophilum TaxID=79262 RepID=A0A087E3B1_9BIFI|nr:hypothetical protein THER5_1923 [Bifidobacterium thermacidophilum subsp. thermacidophilum]
MPMIHRDGERRPPVHQPRSSPTLWTESEITHRNQNQFMPMPFGSQPPTTVTSQNRRIPTIFTCPGNQPQRHNPATRPNPWTKSENHARKPIQSAPIPLPLLPMRLLAVARI